MLPPKGATAMLGRPALSVTWTLKWSPVQPDKFSPQRRAPSLTDGWRTASKEYNDLPQAQRQLGTPSARDASLPGFILPEQAESCTPCLPTLPLKRLSVSETRDEAAHQSSWSQRDGDRLSKDRSGLPFLQPCGCLVSLPAIAVPQYMSEDFGVE